MEVYNLVERANSRDEIEVGEQVLIDLFTTSDIFNGWYIFDQPHINSYKPDFVLVRPDGGILIIEVKNWDLDLNYYSENPKMILEGFRQVENYRNMFLEYFIEKFTELKDKFGNKAYSVIETVVYFHNANRETIQNFLNIIGHSNLTKFWTEEVITILENGTINNSNEECYLPYIIKKVSTMNGNALKNFTNKVISELAYSDYEIERREKHQLKGNQVYAAEMRPGYRRWHGVAGSGKTLVLAEKAVRAAKSQKNALILTFNITLVNYIRDLYSLQYGKRDFTNKSEFKNTQICYFHDFLKAKALKLGIDVKSCPMENINEYTDRIMNSIEEKENEIKYDEKYDYILIDEAQDFNQEWLQWLQKIFLTKDNNQRPIGEFMIMYDRGQDLYDKLAKNPWTKNPEKMESLNFTGRPGELNVSYRSPEVLSYLYNDLATTLGVKRTKFETNNDSLQTELFTDIFWGNFSVIIKDRQYLIYRDYSSLSSKYKNEDITILFNNNEDGIAFVEFMEENFLGINILHTFGDKKTQEKFKINHNKNINLKRAAEKHNRIKFNPGTGSLKVSSLHSYKGWQTPAVIFIYNSESKDNEDVFTLLSQAMTRVKPKKESGEFAFHVHNYNSNYNFLKGLFDIYSY